MFNFGRNKEMTPRPEKDHKFSMKNKTDRTIFLFVIISLLVCVTLLVGILLIKEFLL